MSTPWVPPRPTYHLRVFAVSLAVVVLCLIGFLFGVHLEAIVPASGVVAARDQQEIRAGLAGLVELGWHEALVPAASTGLRLRLDRDGNGVSDPGQGSALAVHHYKLEDGREILPAEVKFHKLEAGDELWPGQVLGHIQADDLQLRLRKLKARLEDMESRGDTAREVLVEYNLLRERLAQSLLRVPNDKDSWLVLKVHTAPRQAVKPGDAMAVLAPLDPKTHQPRELIAQLEIQEKYSGELQQGQTVRLYATMYNQRLHGHALGRIERLEPLGEPGPNDERRFRALAVVTHAPFVLRAGSTCKAEIIVGRKQVYRIILEQ